MRHLLAVAAMLLAPPASAAETLAELNFTVEGQSLFGAGGPESFGASQATEIGTIATLAYGSTAEAGSVTATLEAEVTARWDDSVAVGAPLLVTLTLDRLRSAFATRLAAHADARLDIQPLFARVDPPPFTVIARDYALAVDAAEVLPLGATLEGSDAETMAGAPVPGLPAIAITSRVTLEATQTSRLRVDDIRGMVRATHESGVTVEAPFALAQAAPVRLPLDLPGIWRLQLAEVQAESAFGSEFGLAATGTISAAVGLGCGDPAQDDDNGRLCGGDTSGTRTTPAVPLLAAPPQPLDFAPLSVSLGSVRAS